MKFKVVKYTFAPGAVGQTRMIQCMGENVNIPQSTATTSKIVKANLSESKAKGLRDKLNGKVDLSGTETIVGYHIAPQA